MVEEKLSFVKIRDMVKAACLSPLGKEKVDEMQFSTSYNTIIEQLNSTKEFVRIIEEEEFPADGFYDVRSALQRVRVIGTFIEEEELFDLLRVIDAIGNVVNFFNNKEEGVYYYLQEMSRDVFTFPDIRRAVDRIIDKYGKIKDTASPHLKEIRTEMLSVSSGISRNMNSILRKAIDEGLVEKDTSLAVRDGRLVIPVSPFHKKKIRGIVHDESATGKTVFIEPEVIVEANNKLRELEAEERREIIRILTALTAETIRPRIDELMFSLNYLAIIDFTRAKARFALDTESSLPRIVDEPVLDWVDAIHPLLYLSHKKLGKSIVPLNIKLDDKNRILIISGPNAGGKSVCLKSVGLIQHLMQCGMLVPMNPDSTMGIFHKIMVDIGDEQSIENDLSTYSSHIANMKQFVKTCDNRTILLIDEFGGGTEPQIGGAIAEALLDHFNKNKAYGVITTHYTNLKHFATETDGIVNGAMLYDRHLMQPLFKLEIGNPGSSFALEIARKIGLPESVIQEASEKVGADYVNMEKYLQDIARDKRYWESKRQNIRQKEKHIEELEEKYLSELASINSQKKEIIAKAKTESKELLDSANAKIEGTIRAIKEAQAEKEKTRLARQELGDFKRELSENEKASQDNTIDKKIAQIEERRKQKAMRDKSAAQQQKTQPKPDEITVGCEVRIKGQTGHGTVLEIQGKNVLVAFGNLKTTVKMNTLEKVSAAQIKKQKFNFNYVASSNTSDMIHERSMNFKRELDIRGMRAEEAQQAVAYYIDDAIMIQAGTVRILHGTGGGVLREVVRQYLRTVAGVKDFHDEHVDFGGAGITVVEV
ncbi:MAG: Smr/MutS family protein [Paludibacteraceae bacterium]|nr:Smr/MutS family protein [Paludibacteraceae bacterium]